MKDDGVELRSSRCGNDQNAKRLGNFDKGPHKFAVR